MESMCMRTGPVWFEIQWGFLESHVCREFKEAGLVADKGRFRCLEAEEHKAR
jgi:transposase